MRASNPILRMEDKQEEIYSIQKAVEQLGGISDTLLSLQESLINNEIANIKNIRTGYMLGPKYETQEFTREELATTLPQNITGPSLAQIKAQKHKSKTSSKFAVN